MKIVLRMFLLSLAFCCSLLTIVDLAAAELPPVEDIQPYSLPGMVYDVNTHFQVQDSGYLDISVDSSQTARLTLQSAPRTIEMIIEPGDAPFTTLTVSGLEPGRTYYKYQDDLHHAVLLTADANGSVSFEQDATSRHAIHILENHSTYFIADDATGGNCSEIGTWTPETKTCTLTSDLTDTVQIDASGITLDGAGHSITGPGSGYGVLVQGWKSGVTVENLTITGFTKGVQFLDYVSNSVITGNHFIQNGYAVEIWWSCNYNVVSGNIIEESSNWSVHINRYSYGNQIKNNIMTRNNTGAAVIHSFGNYVNDNRMDANIWYGVLVVWACDNDMNGNDISGTKYGIYMTSPGYESWCGATLARNTLRNNEYGLNIGGFGYYTVYQNNFIDNTVQYAQYYNTNHPAFSLPLPVGGNYWSDYDTPEEGCTDGDENGFCDAPLVISDGRDDYPRVRPYVPNTMPVANAGADQMLLFDSASNGAYITLNGSGSSDPDGDALAYSWAWDGGSASGVSPTVLLPRGTTIVTLTVDDGRGGTATDRVVISIQYAFSGFLPPVNLAKPFKEGSTIPVKFALTDASGASVTGSVSRISTVLLLTGEPSGDPIDGTGNGAHTDSLFRYDEAGSLYIYNLSTSPFTAGDTVRIIATLDDGTAHSIDVGIK